MATSAEREHERVVITKHGRPAAVVLNVEDLEYLEETLDILADQPAVTRLRKSLDEVSAGRAKVMSKEAALALVRRGGPMPTVCEAELVSTDELPVST